MYKGRVDSPCTFHANDTIEDLMMIHNRINRVVARADMDAESDDEQSIA